MADPHEPTPTLVLPARGGSLAIFELPGGRRRIEARLDDPSRFLGVPACETTYPVEVIRQIADYRGAQWTLNEIAHEEDPSFMARHFEEVLLAYLPRSEFEGRTLLDFGSGMGGSSIVLSRLFPSTRIVGVELIPEHVACARVRAEARGLTNLEFHLSPAPDQLPPGLPEFDMVILCAVHEHLFPNERRMLYPMLWSVLRPGGVLYVDQTPDRWFPVETHTSGWPLINYLPAGLVRFLLTRYCNRVNRDATWETLLRDGVRGGTVGEILRLIPRALGMPLLLEPSQRGMKDRIDLWFKQRPPSSKRRLVRALYKSIRHATGVTFLPSLSLAIRKAPL